MLVISFVALAALWPKPRLEGRPAWQAAARRRRARLQAGRDPLRRDRRRAAGDRVAGRLHRLRHRARQLRADVHPDHVLGRARVRLSAIFGDVFRAFSPWRAMGRLLPSKGLRPYPEKLGRWPAATGLLVFTWIELASGWGEDPALLVTAALGYTILTLVAQVVCGVETWTRHGETFAVYYNLFSRISPFETRDRVVGVRPPLSGLPHLEPAPGTVALISVMIGTVTFDGLTQGRLWKDLAVDLTDVVTSLGIPITDAPKVVSTIGLVACVAARRALLPRRHRRRALGRRRHQRRAPAARVHPLARADRDGLRRRALPDVPALRGPGDPLPRLGPVRPGLGPLRHRLGGDRLLAAEPERRLVRAGRVRGRRPRRGADPRPRPRARALRQPEASPSARSTGCWP